MNQPQAIEAAGKVVKSSKIDPITAVQNDMDEQSALAAILEQPTLIKRPLLDTGHERFTGFSADSYQKIFNRHTL